MGSQQKNQEINALEQLEAAKLRLGAAFTRLEKLIDIQMAEQEQDYHLKLKIIEELDGYISNLGRMLKTDS